MPTNTAGKGATKARRRKRQPKNGHLNPITLADDKLSEWIGGSGDRSEVTKSYYDKPVINGLPSAMLLLRQKRINHFVTTNKFEDQRVMDSKF